MKFSYKNVRFVENKILLEKKSDILKIYLHEIDYLFYAKVCWRNYFSLAYSSSTPMGYLFVVTKKMKKLKEAIRIKMPYKEIEKIPQNFCEKLEFYKPHGNNKIFNLK